MNRRTASRADTRLKFKFALLALIGLILSPLAVVHASSPPADSVHFCQLIDYEQWRRDHPRPAGKRLALDVGEPRTVRMIYFLPNDRPFRQEVVDSMKVAIRRVQTFYAEQMEAHGYGNRTFRIETDAQGEPMVHRVDGRHSESHYDNIGGGAMIEELWEVFDLNANIYNIILDGGNRGMGGRHGKIGGVAWLSDSYIWGSAHGGYVGVTAHEIGHAFGLEHDWRDDAYIMSYGPSPDRLSACAAEFLSVHPYFNPEIPTKEGPPPTIELISPRTYPAGSESVPIQLKVADSEGLHQVILFGGRFNDMTVMACRRLSGERDAVVEFEYDGVIPSYSVSRSVSSFSDLVAHPLHVRIVDSEGDVAWTSFMLVEASPYLIATLEGHTEEVTSVAFSPDGTLLASGSWDDTVKLWDVSTERRIATFSGGIDLGVFSMAFSPDGKILAIAAYRLSLWDVATERRIATLGHEAVVSYTVSFSPDGKTLAVGTWVDTIELWDVATERRTATLEGHRSWVNAVSFSPDGTLLASGSGDGTVKLWDVATRQRIATLGHGAEVSAVSFSPDGTLLASGSRSRDGTVKLWDVATRDQITTLEGHTDGWYTYGVTSVSFSPDGTLLATGGRDGTVILRDVLTREKIVTFGHTDEVHSMAFSPDGTTLAAGGRNGTILLWNIEKTAQSLTKVSGDGQEGLAGEPLAKPFVVSVLDQGGSAFAGTVVTFSVTAGGGTLSAATVTTDANGRATTRLTLGSDAGTNTVEATVEGLEPVTFTATAIVQTAHTLAKVSGDNQESPASTQLAAPFVVSVLDQDDSPLAGVDVTFSVAAGGGMLSSTTDANPCTIASSTSSATATTDANGQAATRLTLGSEPGTNTVSATVEGLEPETFTATAAEQAMPHSLTKVCGDDQEGTAGALLAEPLVVSVVDEDGAAMAGVVVSFAVTAGGGTLSSATATTDANGRARTRLTLGSEVGTNTVSATVEELEPVTFTAIGEESPLASLFDAFLGGGKRVALPDRPQLAQNAPNPFNSQTVLSYFLHAPGPARLEVFTLTGQRVAVLQQGPQQAGYHRLHWDGRDDAGRPVASGAYLYRLVTDEAVLTRKLILLR